MMRKISMGLLFVAVLALAAGLVVAQDQGKAPAKAPIPVRAASDELLALWNNTGNKLVAMAEDFPEDKYDFKVQKDQRSFADNLLHVAGTNYEMMSPIKGSPMGPAGIGENPPRATYKTKADVVKLIKAAIADGAALIKEQGDAGLSRELKSPFGPRMLHAQFEWYDMIEHMGEHYGQLVVYYRANNIVPPDSRH
jgi:hypothetical protein